MDSNRKMIVRSNKEKLIKRIAIFVCSLIVIAYFFPREGDFKYNFQVGKPWKYELLTAPFDFPIYKTDESVQYERDSIQRAFHPYYRFNKEAENNNIEAFKANFSTEHSKTFSQAYAIYIESALKEVYQKGIISSFAADSLRRSGKSLIRTAEDNIYRTKPVDALFTPKSAYEWIASNAPNSLDRTLLQNCNINRYLTENLSYDKATSEKMLQTLNDKVSLANGIVQAGERIIDKGEIVTEPIFNILRSLKIQTENQSASKDRKTMLFGGQMLLITLLLSGFWGYLVLFRKEIFKEIRNLVFLLMISVSLIVLCSVIERFGTLYVYSVPFAILPIIVCTFFDSRTALFTHLMTVLTASLTTAFPFEFTILHLSVGVTTIFTLRDLTERSQLVSTAIFVFLTYAAVYTGLSLIQEADWSRISYRMYLVLFINSGLLLFAYLLIYIFEKTFGYISTVTLIELQNINHPALRKLSEECPGTFQHSLQVGALAYEAAKQIGANSQLARTGAFYHDLGKLKNPVFFVENQNGASNPHDDLSYQDSAQIIISHVPDGVRLAEKYNLPRIIIEFIRTHHGVNTVKYFYNSFRNDFPDLEIDDSLFTYPGPLPFSKETAILMMADAVEATSRSLHHYTDETISDLVENIIDGQIAEGCFKNTPISFKDVERVKQIFKKRLKIMYHTRISYPELNKK